MSERFDTARQPGTEESTETPATDPAQGSKQEQARIAEPGQLSVQPAAGTGSPQVSEAEARRVAEEAREAAWLRPSFGKQLFLGDFQLGLIHPYPEPDPELDERGKAFCERLAEFCTRAVNGAIIENDAKIPDEVVKGLAALGAFGMKISPEYGGLGLSQLSYNRALMIVSSVSPALGALVSAHQSIGVPQPLALFGT